MTPEFFEANWPVILIVAIVVLLLAFFWLSANRKASVVDKNTKDVLDEGAAPAARNQALIDAPKAAVKDTGVPVPEATPEPAPAPAPEPEPTPTPEPVAPLIQEDPAPPVLGEAPSEPAGEADIPAVETTPAPAPAPDPAPAPAPSAGAADDLTQIKGLGPKLAALLNTLGVTTFAQIARWDDADIDRVDAQLDRFKGRIRRDSWVEQAKLLAAGDEAGFSDKFGQNG